MKEDISFFSKEKILDVFKIVYKARFLDKKMEALVKQNKGTTFFLSTAGHEIVGAVFSSILKKKDWAFPYFRDRAFSIGFSCPIKEILASFLARDIKTHSGGMMMLDHFSDKEKNIPCQSSCVGSQFLQAVGVAKGIKLRKEDSIVYVSAGDGATSQGDFHEALNFSSIHNLPIMFVIQDNNFAISTPSFQQTAGKDILNFAKGYPNFNLYKENGANFEDFYKKALEATTKTKNHPTLFVAKIPRLSPHSISDDQSKYKEKVLLEKEKKQDPLLHLEKYILEKDIISKERLGKLKEEIKKEVEFIKKESEKIPFPSKEHITNNLFKETKIKNNSEFSLSLEKDCSMIEALNDTLKKEMEKDKSIIIFGEDVQDKKGGVFGVTKGLSTIFSEKRCFNTPLAESTIIGLAIGLSFKGFKPIAEIQFSDYLWTGANQLLNELPSIYFRSKKMWNAPVVIRMTFGGYVQGGPYHSQSPEAVFAHIPGLKIAIPSNPIEARILLHLAIKDPNPVIFLEHKILYRKKIKSFKKEDYLKKDFSLKDFEFGKARIVKKGKDLTIVSWGLMVEMVYEVLEEENISCELIDLRTLIPLDIFSILESIKKTSKLLIVHEACKTGGFGAEIAAQVLEKGFSYLDAPIKRVGAKDFPIAYNKDLEDEILPQKEDIKEKILELLNF